MNSLQITSIFNSKFYKHLKLFHELLCRSPVSNSYILILMSILLTAFIISINCGEIPFLEILLAEICPFIMIFLNIFNLKFLNFSVPSYNTNILYAIILCPTLIITAQITLYYFTYKQKKNKYETLELAKTIHDLKNSLFSVAGYAEVGNTEKVKEKVYEICSKLNNSDLMTPENIFNISINKLINTKKSITDKLHIELNYSVDEIKYSTVTANDFCILIGNMLDNAIEACKKMSKTNDRFINLEIRQFKDRLEIMLENSTISSPNINMKTTKSNKIMHGHGLKSINKIVSKYNGEIKNTIENNIFLVEIVLPIIH